MLPRREGGQPLCHLYLFVASEGFLEGPEIYNGVYSLMAEDILVHPPVIRGPIISHQWHPYFII